MLHHKFQFWITRWKMNAKHSVKFPVFPIEIFSWSIMYTNFLQTLWIILCGNCMLQSLQKSLASNSFDLKVSIKQIYCSNFHPKNSSTQKTMKKLRNLITSKNFWRDVANQLKPTEISHCLSACILNR